MSNASGSKYWRSVEELAGSPEIDSHLAQEFPGYDPDTVASLPRRNFLKLMGAAMALGGLTLSGCRRWPKEELAPYVVGAINSVPGVPESYATAMDLAGVAQPLVVQTFDGRPIKVEGNPSHPQSATFNGRLGSANRYAQASVLDLYDMARRTGIRNNVSGEVVPTWDAFRSAITPHFTAMADTGGAEFAVLSEATSSPSVDAMRRRLAQAFPAMKWYEYEPTASESIDSGAQRIRPVFDLARAVTVVSIDADLLGTHPAHTMHAHGWSEMRRKADDAGHRAMNRMYIAESIFSITGGVADERIGVKPSEAVALLAALAAALGVGQVPAPQLTPEQEKWVGLAAADIKADPTHSVVAVGGHLPESVKGLAALINQQIGAEGTTVRYVAAAANDTGSIQQLAAAIEAGQVKTLLILGGNPAYDAPADLNFAERIKSVPMSMHHSVLADETSAVCTWHLPRTHYMEAWGDTRSWDGTVVIQQPLILPLFDARSTIEVLALIAGDELLYGNQIVRRTFAQLTADAGEAAFRTALHDGLVPQTAFRQAAGPIAGGPAQTPAGEMEVRFVPDTSVWDGRFASNPWLQEMPDTMTKLVWDNAAIISIADARRLGLNTGDMVKLTVDGRSIEIPVYLQPGQPRGVIALPLGYGRKSAGEIGTGVGFDVYAIRASQGMHFAPVEVSRAAGRHQLVTTQHHHLIDPVGEWARTKRVGKKGEPGKIIREATLAAYAADPMAPHRDQHVIIPLQLWDPPHSFRDPHAWGMSIDMNTCIGCNACVVACQAENNVPVVGKKEVYKNREMHWLRIDRYYKGKDLEDANPQVVYQPMMCVHCENAPCESVCPVAATVHDTEGLNTMVYNRCIGTRYCSNNCPYKVRRFNYFDWHAHDPMGVRHQIMGNQLPWLGIPDEQQKAQIDPLRQMQFNPDVSVRMRGVMEKCTYCVQRIKRVTIDRKNNGEAVQDFDIVTACQQACPTQAIVFGNLNDTDASVSRHHDVRQYPRGYFVLDDLNTRPRTRYLAKLRNPSGAGVDAHDGHDSAPAGAAPAETHG